MLTIEGEPDPKPYKVHRVTSDGAFVEHVAEYATETEARQHRRRRDWHYKFYFGRTVLKFSAPHETQP